MDSVSYVNIAHNQTFKNMDKEKKIVKTGSTRSQPLITIIVSAL